MIIKQNEKENCDHFLLLRASALFEKTPMFEELEK
jgi:hypothetical protein